VPKSITLLLRALHTMTGARPRVGVLTPVHNGALYLAEAMASVQAQTHDNLVHVVLDNASTDATADIITAFIGQRVPVVRLSNPALLPLVDNWNRLVALGAPGCDYFRILCADDTMPPEAIGKMVALGEADPRIAIVGSQRETHHGVDGLGWDTGRCVLEGADVIRQTLLGKGLDPPHFLYRARTVGLRQPFFDTSILGIDLEAGFFILSQPGARFGFIHEPLGWTRLHAGSISQSVVRHSHSNYFDWLHVVHRYGPEVMAPDDFARYERRFRRHHLGRLLVWLIGHGNVGAFRAHLRRLRQTDRTPRLSDFADALGDYALRKLGLRPRWDQFPQG
jgi:glycosyltransferase involved in cell wall biosynthesis